MPGIGNVADCPGLVRSWILEGSLQPLLTKPALSSEFRDATRVNQKTLLYNISEYIHRFSYVFV